MNQIKEISIFDISWDEYCTSHVWILKILHHTTNSALLWYINEYLNNVLQLSHPLVLKHALLMSSLVSPIKIRTKFHSSCMSPEITSDDCHNSSEFRVLAEGVVTLAILWDSCVQWDGTWSDQVSELPKMIQNKWKNKL